MCMKYTYTLCKNGFEKNYYDYYYCYCCYDFSQRHPEKDEYVCLGSSVDPL